MHDCNGSFTIQERLTLTQEAVQTELDVLKQGLQKRQQAAKVKELLNLMQDTAHVMSKVLNTPAHDVSQHAHHSQWSVGVCITQPISMTVPLQELLSGACGHDASMLPLYLTSTLHWLSPKATLDT